jgi:hypothetical protein
VNPIDRWGGTPHTDHRVFDPRCRAKAFPAVVEERPAQRRCRAVRQQAIPYHQKEERRRCPSRYW